MFWGGDVTRYWVFTTLKNSKPKQHFSTYNL